MDRFLKISKLRDLEKQVSKCEISYSKMVELINYEAVKYFACKTFCKCKEPKYNYPEMVWCNHCGLEIKQINT